ncbi:MAG: hypothetical protein ACXABZ_14065 [Candidatus Thorarchaeota archaeon]|jgi:hypothetical protein
MKARQQKLAALGLVISLILLGTSSITTSAYTGGYSGAQIVEPFTEMLQGVYVASEWWNESATDISGSEANDTDPLMGSDYYEYYYYVEDNVGNGYYVLSEFESDWFNQWSYSSLLVTIILDPDGTYMAWLANEGNFTSLWEIMWWPNEASLSGDEVFIYSTFYYSEYNYSYHYRENFTWYSESWDIVDPNEVIPNLAPDYEWASWMNGSYQDDQHYEWAGFGYDVNEMTTSGNTTQWMQHYSSGISVFNDTDNDGTVDIAYKEIGYDFDEDGTIDWITTVMDYENSELMYDLMTTDATVGDFSLPTLNQNGQIEWSAEVIDIEGKLVSSYEPVFFCGTGLFCEPYFNDTEPVEIPTDIEHFKLVFRFEVSDESAILKIDQHVGDFTDPVSGNILPEADGLSLLLSYWSAFSSYTLTGEFGDGNDLRTDTLESAPVAFSEGDERLVSVEFGGTYVWGRDGQTYEVGTTILPMFYEVYGAEDITASDLSVGSTFWEFQNYYYSSCYGNWDGYAITHDPIFTVFPMNAPGPVSQLVSDLMLSSIIIMSAGLVAIAVVCVRTNKARKAL